MTDRTIVRSPLHVIAEELDGSAMGCCDEEHDKIWVTVAVWHWRRAYLTSARPFLTATGLRPDELIGEHFIADVHLDPPPAVAEVDEEIYFGNIELSPPIEEIHRRLGIPE